jgi:diguanylate cyclase (GGDEF)-like protein/PAS domain S-box-containing protein
MPAASLPENESERLAALERYDVLDTAPEPAFDDIVALAALICGTPIALITLVDQARQWFKAKVGIDAPQTPRDVAFCAHALLEPNDLLVVPNAMEDSRFADNPFVTGTPAIRFYAGAPLVTHDGFSLGTLCAVDRVPRDLTPIQRGALQALARQVISQLELRRALHERTLAEAAARYSEAKFHAMLEAMQEGLILQDADAMIQVCNASAERILGLTAAQMQGRDSLDPCWHTIHEDGSPFPGNTHPVPVCLRDGKPKRDVIMGVHKPDGKLNWIAVNATPMFRDGEAQPYAALATFADITQRKLTEELLEQQMKRINDYSVMLELQTLELEAQKRELEAANTLLRALATTDGLTGLANHRHFQERLGEEFRRAQRYGIPLSLIMLDVDQFKQYNDSFGHPAGDLVLKRVGNLLTQTVRETDLAARYGGEEFAVLLPETQREGAEALAERIRVAVAEAEWDKRDITVSVGVASHQVISENAADLVEQADQALYTSKTNGRNRVSVFGARAGVGC